MKVCIACQADVEGRRASPIAEDRVIRTIRGAKTALGVAQNNQLFVCEACMPAHLERRRSFEKTLLFASVFAGFMLLLIIVAPILNGNLNLWAIASGFIVAGFILLMPVLFKYVPAVQGVSAGAMTRPSKSAAPPPQQPPQPAQPQPPRDAAAPSGAGRPKEKQKTRKK